MSKTEKYHYLITYKPPRASFAEDATPEETAVKGDTQKKKAVAGVS